jgi:hypothetical protein
MTSSHVLKGPPAWRGRPLGVFSGSGGTTVALDPFGAILGPQVA